VPPGNPHRADGSTAAATARLPAPAINHHEHALVTDRDFEVNVNRLDVCDCLILSLL